MKKIDDISALRALYPAVHAIAERKQLNHIDPHARRFIALSPFVLLATADAEGRHDVSPRGGPAGFVHVADARTLLIPDWQGNNRLDSLANIVVTGEAGLLFLIPGVDETLRINGPAEIHADETLRAQFVERGRMPTTVVRVTVREAFLHCAKAFMRSELWSPAAIQDRSVLPTLGQMIRDQVGSSEAVESQEQMVSRFKTELY
jgi:uncharacterized protein